MEIITIDEVKRFIIRDFNKGIDDPKERLTSQKVFDFGLRIICMMRIDEKLADAIAESNVYVEDLMEKTLSKKVSE
jgi:hypothetical protein